MSRMKYAFAMSIVLGVCGCDHDESIDPPAPASDITQPNESDIEVRVDRHSPAVNTRSGGRNERRESLREAIDNVDVNVDESGVDVDVD